MVSKIINVQSKYVQVEHSNNTANVKDLQQPSKNVTLPYRVSNYILPKLSELLKGKMPL